MTSTGCTATISTTTAAVSGSSFSSVPTIVVTGTGFLPEESVQVYFNGAVPFGDPSQGSFAATTTADTMGSIMVTLSMKPLPAPNNDYPITAVGDHGSCASLTGIIIPNTFGVPIEPLGSTALAPVAAIISGAVQTVSSVSQTGVISSSRIMSNAVSLAASVDTASQNNFSAVPGSVRQSLWVDTGRPAAPNRDSKGGGPTWGVFQTLRLAWRAEFQCPLHHHDGHQSDSRH